MDTPRLRNLCVFCGSRHGTPPAYRSAAEALGRELAKRGIGLVYGGGKVGLMGVVADAVLAAGGTVRGVIPEKLAHKELMHERITELHIVRTMHERKALMAEMADGFIALPGGFGTFDELIEAITWGQLGIHRKPVGILDIGGFFAGLLELVDRAVADGFIDARYRGLVLCHEDVDGLLEAIGNYTPPAPILQVLGLEVLGLDEV